jgi:hypothetical protein
MWASFFDIPVYRLTEKEYEARQQKHVNKEIATEKQSYYINKMYENDPKEEKRMRDHFGSVTVGLGTSMKSLDGYASTFTETRLEANGGKSKKQRRANRATNNSNTESITSCMRN